MSDSDAETILSAEQMYAWLQDCPKETLTADDLVYRSHEALRAERDALRTALQEWLDAAEALATVDRSGFIDAQIRVSRARLAARAALAAPVAPQWEVVAMINGYGSIVPLADYERWPEIATPRGPGEEWSPVYRAAAPVAPRCPTCGSDDPAERLDIADKRKLPYLCTDTFHAAAPVAPTRRDEVNEQRDAND